MSGPQTKIRSLAYPVERVTLRNGLRVVLAPDKAAPVVGVGVYYDVGFRSEPEGRTGFAHLFEHLMFQGSENVGKAQHPQYVQGAGGTFNGSTHPDYTNYFELLPAGALELALFLEADRMRAPRITQENLENQIAVVQEEIRVNVLNRPYGGFPWITLAAGRVPLVPQRAQRLRRLLRAGSRDPRRRGRLLHHLLRPGQRGPQPGR